MCCLMTSRFYIVFSGTFSETIWHIKFNIAHTPDLGRFRIRSRNQRTNLNPNPDLIPDSESCVVESDLESESCRFESEWDSDS